MDSLQKQNLLENIFLKESWSWQGSTFTIHKLIKSSPRVDEKLKTLVEYGGIIRDIKNVYIITFVHPDREYAMSLVSDLNPNGKAWFAYADPDRMIINKRMSNSGFSLEKITESSFKTTFFLGSGSECQFKLLEKIEADAISTTVPIPLYIFGAVIYQNLRVKFDKRSKYLKTNGLKLKQIKLWFIPQIVTKSNYIFTYKLSPL